MLYLNAQVLEPTIFPDNTSQVWKVNPLDLNGRDSIIRWEYEHEGEFLQLAQLRALLYKYKAKNVDLYLTYLPYGRQDKEVSNDATFALRPFAQLLNTLNFRQVSCVDPHSKVAGALIHGFVPIYPINEVKSIMRVVEADLLCYPDKGALSKYVEIYDAPYIYGEKVRDQATGNITHYQVFGANDISGKNILVVDDLIDGGLTFCILAKALKEAGVKSYSLFASHGIFSKGTKPLYDAGYERIFTKDGEQKL
jgi:ribose-phosphate pyrophosphokinase